MNINTKSSISFFLPFVNRVFDVALKLLAVFDREIEGKPFDDEINHRC